MARNNSPTLTGSVMDASCRFLAVFNEPLRAVVGSRSSRPVATAYRNTCPQIWRKRCGLNLVLGLQTPKHCQHLGGADAVDRSPPQPREGVSLQRPLGLRSSTGRKIPAVFQPLQRDGFKTIINGKLRFELLKLLLFGRVLPCPQLRPRRGALLNRLLEGDLRIDTDAQQLSLPAKLYFILQYLEPLGITSR